ncbi:hypothetical protein CKQ53_16165 [Lonsdalea britannica]|uniref:Lipoprotein n=1 Tax=Lonsdalea britannica TaxID=1082704 RepID=A0AAD0SJB2_9GAMM|nr:hypothetical protein [Lonsdalea britannica]AXW88360.1 hypothetical protein CKQ53_16165 [Lonsdalea britannica]OSN07935.1 hypothetical protein AU510_04925 [Lonsdalea britannica]
MRKNHLSSVLAIVVLVTLLSGCAHVGMELYGRLKPAPSADEVKEGFTKSMNISPDQVTISNIKGKEGNGTGLTGSASKDYTFDATINGKTKNCSFKQLINDDIHFTGCTVKNAAVSSW